MLNSKETAPEYFTTQVASILYSISQQTLRYYIKKKVIPAVKKGKQYFIKRADLLKFLNGADYGK
ncbi:MAG TPA: helix-turn-helix domain-containing protein [Candidatus Kapabacteria bacterium]|nr:helix-turn-helix domain-containing protein [Candidatus Kapabacteria bacterium]